MDGQLTRTDSDEAGDYVVPNVLSPRDLVFRPNNMDETVPHTVSTILLLLKSEISSLQPSSVAVQPGLSLTWSQTLKTGFLTTRLIS